MAATVSDVVFKSALVSLHTVKRNVRAAVLNPRVRARAFVQFGGRSISVACGTSLELSLFCFVASPKERMVDGVSGPRRAGL